MLSGVNAPKRPTPDQKGVSSIEYIVVVAILLAAVIGTIVLFGNWEILLGMI